MNQSLFLKKPIGTKNIGTNILLYGLKLSTNSIVLYTSSSVSSGKPTIIVPAGIILFSCIILNASSTISGYSSGLYGADLAGIISLANLTEPVSIPTSTPRYLCSSSNIISPSLLIKPYFSSEYLIAAKLA
uniref:Uncharacterized protein ORF-c08_047 n=1 Tax=Saccharolobus solfataricus TaxID=2287 RepID=Q9UWZ7_SACSO|nr:hypothetical protein [Saccharolobus solfataricus P2]